MSVFIIEERGGIRVVKQGGTLVSRQLKREDLYHRREGLKRGELGFCKDKCKACQRYQR